MTIYAIVNNLIPSGSAAAESPIWTIISPSAVIQGGNPYFVPDFAACFKAVPALAVKIGKLGKSVAPRFAYRYVDSAAPCCLMLAADLLEKLIKQSFPWSAAVSYDRSLVMGQFAKYPMEKIQECITSLAVSDGSDSQEVAFHGNDLSHSIEQIICAVSKDNTIKTGDIIIAGFSRSAPQLRPGLRASLALDSGTPLKFNIR